MLWEDNKHRGRTFLAWFLSSGGVLALLFTVVIIGEAYRIRDVMLNVQETHDYHNVHDDKAHEPPETEANRTANPMQGDVLAE
jgi:hypothetical protein